MSQKPKVWTKELLISELTEISNRGFVPATRSSSRRNDGAVGNTLETLLGIEENNLALPNAAEWELKAQRIGTGSRISLCHMEPSPRTFRFVPQVLLPFYGWTHDEAGSTYPATEMSFRMTIQGNQPTSRGFGLDIDRSERRISVTYNPDLVADQHLDWKKRIIQEVGSGGLEYAPYWGFSDLEHKMASKLGNMFLVLAEAKRLNGHEHFHYKEGWLLADFDFELFLKALEEGRAVIEFDARTGHNHGTKFRISRSEIKTLYGTQRLLFSS
jgi:hypothetical protein